MSEPISIVVPVLNDRDALAELLDALERQTRAPDEIVIVDGGSTDGTRELLAERNGRLPITVVEEPGNISHARNTGVRAASSAWIACTDAGCRPAVGWLEALDRARDGNDFLGGVYRVTGDSDLERSLSAALYPSCDEIGSGSAALGISQRAFGRRFDLGATTGRSMAFTRAAWEAAGGFPEQLYAGEDVAFSAAVLAAGLRGELVGDAVVDWRPRPTWRANARMYVIYARGDVRQGNSARHLIRAATWLALPFLARSQAGRAAIAVWALGYSAVPIARARRRGNGPGVVCRIPLAIALKDLAQITGAALGLADALRSAPQPNPNRARKETQ